VRLFTPARLLIAGLSLLVVVLALAVLPSNEYIFLPDPAHAVAPLVTVQGGHDPTRGGIYFVDVVVRKATILERLFPGIHNGADLYPASAVDPPGVTDQLRRTLDLEDMKLSQQVAAAVALRALGRHVVLRSVGVRVLADQPGLPAIGKLIPGDVITAVDGKPVPTLSKLRSRLATHRVGDVVAFTILRGKQTLVEKLKTVGVTDPGQKKPRAIVGIAPEQAVDIHLPVQVSIDAHGVGGPSAGVAFALDVMEELGRDVVHGHKVAVTGEIHLDGTIGAIGGIKQKTIGARAAHVDAFLVPGDNAREARKYAHGLRIIPVETFPQALRALATLGGNG
jgi:PDZ domain-containing protein